MKTLQDYLEIQSFWDKEYDGFAALYMERVKTVLNSEPAGISLADAKEHVRAFWPCTLDEATRSDQETLMNQDDIDGLF